MEEQKEKRVKREFFLSSASVKNRSTVLVLTLLVIVLGIRAYTSMPKAAWPDIVMPQIYVGVAYPGNSPVDMEKLITRPLEKEINTISDVDKISSTSIQGYTTILVEFDFKIEPVEALRKVKDAVDKARSEPGFPDDLPVEPNIFEMNFSEFPILNINLSGDFSMNQLKGYAEYLEDEIETLPEISKVDIRGLQEKEVEISVDMQKMEAVEVSFNDISGAIGNENVTISGGDILVDGMRRTVRAVGDFASMEEIENVIVKMEKGNIVYLKDIADVTFDFEERTSFAREFGKPVVMLDVVKKAGENLLTAMDGIKEIMAKAETEVLPENLEISLTNDQSQMTKTMVSNLENSIISGVILVVLVLLFFLGLRNALFVGVAIPLSMFTAFMILGAMGVTINMMVLFSLILALGMLVDNGIVVVENIYRLMDQGMSPIQAAKEGAGEVAWAIIASTATTLAAFLPLIFWPGMMGSFMGFLPITLIIVLGSSLFVGLVINPVLTSLFMKIKEEDINVKPRRLIFASSGLILGSLLIAGDMTGLGILLYGAGLISLLAKYSFVNENSTIRSIAPGLIIMLVIGVLDYLAGATGPGNALFFSAIFILLNLYVFAPGARGFQSSFIPWLEIRYERFLSYALQGKRPRRFLFGTIALLFFSFIIMGVFPPKILFFPENMPKYVNIFIEKPIGTDISETNRVTKEIEEIVMQEMKKYNVDAGETNFLTESIIGNVGEGTSDPNAGPSMGTTPEKARVTVTFVDFADRTNPETGEVVKTGEVMKAISQAVKNKIPGVRISVDKDAAGPPVGPPINIEVSGDDLDQLMVEADKIKAYLNSKNVPGVDELKLDVELGKPELIVEIDRAKARRLSLSTGQIASSIRTALYGQEISQYKEGEEDYPIQLRFSDRYRYDAENLMNQRITFRDQTNGQIKQVPISAVAKPIKSSTFSAVKRKNLDRLITVFSTVTEGYNPNEVVETLKAHMEGFALPAGVNIKFTGEQEEQAKEMEFLGGALMIAVFLIFLIIVAQFNSSSTPVIIVGSVIFSLIGVLLGLVIFRMEFVIIMTMIGIISLAGVVVNNAIVLIDYTNLVMQRRIKELGLDEHERLSIDEIIYCIVEGGKLRLRPVLLTAITTVLGLLPLATGMNINYTSLITDLDPEIFFGGDNVVFWGPMSWTVIFGLIFATFLTLVIVPVMYLQIKKLKGRIFTTNIRETQPVVAAASASTDAGFAEDDES